MHGRWQIELPLELPHFVIDSLRSGSGVDMEPDALKCPILTRISDRGRIERMVFDRIRGLAAPD